MDTSFTGAYMYWVGMDTDGASDAQLEEFNHFYSHVHLAEVLALNPGFLRAHRFELSRPDPRGDFGPRWLAVYELEDEGAVATYAARNDGPAAGRPKYTPTPPAWRDTARTRWRLIWRRIAELGALAEPPHLLSFIGIDPPADADGAAIGEFNDFYTNVHLGEVMVASGYGRGTRWERERAFLHPEPGCPRYLAAYEADERVGRELETRPRPPTQLSSGPVVWQEHATPWRLVYRRMHSVSAGR